MKMTWLGIGVMVVALSAVAACSDDKDCGGANCASPTGGGAGQSSSGQGGAGGGAAGGSAAGGMGGDAGHNGGSGGAGGGPVPTQPNWVECLGFPDGNVNQPWSITCTLSGYPPPDMDVLGVEDGTPYPNWMNINYDQAMGSVTFSGTPDSASEFAVEINLSNSEGFLQVTKYFTIQP